MTLLDGKQTAQFIKDEIRAELELITIKGFRKPHLVAILVGNDGASRTYVDSKERNSIALGFNSTVVRLPELTSQDELTAIVKRGGSDFWQVYGQAKLHTLKGLPEQQLGDGQVIRF